MRFITILLLALGLLACQDDNPSTDDADTGADAAGSGDADTGADAAGSGDANEADVPLVEESREDGEACEGDIQCASGACLGPYDGFPEGMCTVTGCTSRRDCFGVGAACLRGEFNGNLCVALCTRDADCRDGYVCRGEGGGSYCFPDVAGAALEPTCDSVEISTDSTGSPWFGTPNRLNRHEIQFDISEEATAFTVVAYDRREKLFTENVIFPDGTQLGIYDYASYSFSPTTFETVSPFLFPGGPQYIPDLQAGTYSMEIAYSGRDIDEICYVVMEETAGLTPDDEPLEVDINFYFVDVSGLNASSAPDDPAFQDMVAQFNLAFAQAGVQLGEVQYLDVLGDVADRYSIIREQDAVFEMVTLSRQPGPTRDDLLRVNVFFNNGFAGEMFGVLGVSAGIPGAAGLHGAQATGLVFSAESLGSERGNRTVGQTLAHELGHFLGLFHTTERISGGGQQDQLEDTPNCPGILDDMSSCPDLNNLMFPVAGWNGTASVSAGQSVIIRANPLTKFAE